MGQNPYEQNSLVDENGKNITFNSMIDALNYMGKLGWDFEQAYVVTESNTNVYHWLLSKVINTPNSAKDGITTKHDYKEK